MSMMMFLFLAAVMPLREAEAFTISSIPIRHRHRHRHMRPSVALNVALDPRTLGLNGLDHNLNEFNHNLNNLNNLNPLDQQLSQKDEFPLPHSTNPYIILGIRHTP
eukprot:397498_1